MNGLNLLDFVVIIKNYCVQFLKFYATGPSVRLTAWGKSATIGRTIIKFENFYFSKLCSENLSFY